MLCMQHIRKNSKRIIFVKTANACWLYWQLPEAPACKAGANWWRVKYQMRKLRQRTKMGNLPWPGGAHTGASTIKIAAG